MDFEHISKVAKLIDVIFFRMFHLHTPAKFNIAPENAWQRKTIAFPIGALLSLFGGFPSRVNFGAWAFRHVLVGEHVASCEDFIHILQRFGMPTNHGGGRDAISSAMYYTKYIHIVLI